MIPHPIVIAKTVKGDFDKRITADLLHPVECGLIDIEAVGIQFENIHSACINALDNFKEGLVRHRFAAGNCKAVDAAPLCFVHQFVCFFK